MGQTLDDSAMSRVFYLEMKDPSELVPSEHVERLTVTRLTPPRPATNRQMYASVGKAWNWTDWLTWSDQQWQAFADRDQLQTWLADVDGQAAGYFELESQTAGNVEIVHFGLLPDFIGQGLGGVLLTMAIRCAWRIEGTKRVWLHTCQDDHPRALKNYLSRGLRVYDVSDS